MGFAHAQVGDPIEPVLLPDPDGMRHPFIGEAQANLFIFFDPGKEHSIRVLQQLADIKGRLASESVKWTAILSDRFPVADALEILEENDLDIALLVDEEDNLFGKLGVALHPVIGITDKDHVLRHYLHFRKVNFPAIIEGALQEVLGNITKEEFEHILHPSQDGELNQVDRKKGARLGLARQLIRKGKLDAAESQIRIHLRDWPGDEPALELLATVLELKKAKPPHHQ